MVELVVSAGRQAKAFQETASDAGSEQVLRTARRSSANTAKLRDDLRNRMLIPGRHYMRASNSGDFRKFLQQIDADALSFFSRIAGVLESRDQRVWNERAGKVIAHPDG
jgi:hypothetical protein